MRVYLGEKKTDSMKTLTHVILRGKKRIGLHKYDKETCRHSFTADNGLIKDDVLLEVFDNSRVLVENHVRSL